MEEKKQIYNLIVNSLETKGKGRSKERLQELVDQTSEERILELAEREKKNIEYLIRISDNDFDYWRKKMVRLNNIINRLK